MGADENLFSIRWLGVGPQRSAAGATASATTRPRILSWAVLALASEALGFPGYALFELSPINRRDLALSWRALGALHRMFLLVLVGCYRDEVMRAIDELRRFAEAECASARLAEAA